jgi:hypothetical protein
MPPTQTARAFIEEDLVLADKDVAAKAKDILNCMANAVSAMKIFPSDHATVRNFVDALTKNSGTISGPISGSRSASRNIRSFAPVRSSTRTR